MVQDGSIPSHYDYLPFGEGSSGRCTIRCLRPCSTACTPQYVLCMSVLRQIVYTCMQCTSYCRSCVYCCSLQLHGALSETFLTTPYSGRTLTSPKTVSGDPLRSSEAIFTASHVRRGAQSAARFDVWSLCTMPGFKHVSKYAHSLWSLHHT